MSDSVRVDPGTLRGAAGQTGAVAHAALPHTDQVQPCAPDHVSVAASSRFSAAVSVARRYTTIANALAQRYGVMLQTSAATYDAQESVSAASLGIGGAGPVPASTPIPWVDIDAVATRVGGGGVSAPAGEVPAAPRDIARLIEAGRTGGGMQAWQAVETSLRSEAGQLEQAAAQLGAAIAATEASWDAASAQAATARLRTLQAWYEGHARHVAGLAQQASTHVQNFQRASTAIPTYRQVVAGERELQTAVQANIAAGGMRREAVVHAQVKVAGLYQASTAGFSSYSFAEAVPGPGPGAPVPPPGAAPDSPDVQRAKAPGGTPVTTKPDPAAAGAPLEPVQQGPAAGESMLSGGPSWPPTDVDPTQGGRPLLETVTDVGAGAAPMLVPGIIGGVVGGLGGVLGGLAGPAGKALQGVQQATAPMMSGLGQHPGGGAPSGGQSPPESPESLGEPEAGSGIGGSGGGETAPASDGGAMAAPAPLAAAPEAAAPAPAPAAPAAAPASAEPTPAVGAMGSMLPPMGGRGGSGSGPHNKQLYQDRKLQVVVPPNSEPVKNRREGRNKDDDRERDKSRGQQPNARK
ncbi:PE family protein [Mycobacterium paragordonae]|uniref:PE family protein n=1 Tax=Mycobacterium TaxID=1763 RepID=UPI0009E785FF|nr:MULTISPECIES: PE family protein [Mycobacterium]MDP7732712.1 PE family protein [Mycobacterium sp. TY813]TDK86596.1 PE family protein [Mycobacterium paragordonae]